jgi:hypothetical protein
MKQDRLNNWITVITTPSIEETTQDYIEIDGVIYTKVGENG